jgi:ABC-type sugar transport system ATPase subunit
MSTGELLRSPGTGCIPAAVLLRTQALVVARDNRTIVRGVDFELERGEVVALLGPNGAGKSTLLDALVGAVPIASGSVACEGRVAVALQAADLPRRTVLANVMLALSWWGVPRAERAGRAHEALQTLSAEHLAAREASELSGGERRRVHLARVLAVRPDVLLLDEPFAGLDLHSRASLLEDSASVLRSASRATLVVVHDRAEAWALADRLLVMIDGQIVASGAPRSVLAAPPTPVVARFLGYDGELRQGDRLLLTRAADVTLDPGGDVRAAVVRATPLEHGTRLELSTPDGRLFTVGPHEGPRPGDTVSVSLRGGVRFPLETSAPEPTA